MIKAVIFDLGNVTVKFDETPHFRKWEKTGKKSFSEVKNHYKNSSTRKAFERGEITSRQFYSKFVEDLGLKIKYDDFALNYCDIFTRDYEVENIIKSLKGIVRLVLLSNTNILQYKFIRKKFKILDLFDDFVLSYKIGMRKPNPFIFIKAVQKAGVMPYECLYFDDIPEFIWVARLLGIKAFQYKNTEKLKKDLESIGVF